LFFQKSYEIVSSLKKEYDVHPGGNKAQKEVGKSEISSQKVVDKFEISLELILRLVKIKNVILLKMSF
jgi:hypothetical protein